MPLIDHLSAYFTKLETSCQKSESNICVGLDPDPELMPRKFSGAEGVFQFCAEIVGATSDYAAAYKPNIAFFESIGTEGWHVLQQVIELVPKDIPVIVDAKRGDIGSTAKHYAKSIYEVLKADAVTLNPFMGRDSAQPFLDHADKGAYFLCLTSNPGAQEFQQWFDLYLQIANRIGSWNEHHNCGLVVGATQPTQLSNVHQEAPDLPLLIPGVGTQGGGMETIIPMARGRARHKMLINVSRAVIYASNKADFARAARKALLAYRDKFNQALAGK